MNNKGRASAPSSPCSHALACVGRVDYNVIEGKLILRVVSSHKSFTRRLLNMPPANTTPLALLCACAALYHVPAHAQVPRVPGAPGPPALGRDALHTNAPAAQHAHPNRIVRRRRVQHAGVAANGGAGAADDGRAHAAAPAAVGGDLPLRVRGLNPRRRVRRSTTGPNFVCDEGCEKDVTTTVQTGCNDGCDAGCTPLLNIFTKARCDKGCDDGCDGTAQKITPGVCNAGCKCTAGHAPTFSAVDVSTKTPTQCAKCPANRFLAQCAKCPAGQYSPDTATWFQPCVQKTVVKLGEFSRAATRPRRA